PFARYEHGLDAGLRQALEAAGQYEEATSVWLRIRPDLDWNGEYNISSEPVAAQFEPYYEGSYSGTLVELSAPSFPEAAPAADQYRGHSPLDPRSAWHYLMARTTAAFGRCVGRYSPTLPVFLSLLWAVFRIS